MARAKGIEDKLLEMLADPVAVAGQADLTQAAALERQSLSFRQRAGAALVQLRRARQEGADATEIAELEAKVQQRANRLKTASQQAGAANVKRPAPQKGAAQIFARATGPVEKPPLTLAALDKGGEVVARKAANNTGIVHLVTEGDLKNVTLQLSDCDGRVVYRSAEPVTVASGDVLYLDAETGVPEPEPCPVPDRPKMPDLVGQSEGVALTLLDRLGSGSVNVKTRVGDGPPGIVIEQVPSSGTVLADKTPITLTVRTERAGTPDVIYVPGLIGDPADSAVARLKTLGLDAATKPRADDGPAGIVLAQDPGEGNAIDPGETVTLTVSQTRDETPKTVTVPDVTGKSGEMALEMLAASGLKPDIVDTADPQMAAGVTAQDPAAGTVVSRKSTVKLSVNRPPDTDTGKIVLPELKNRPLSEVRNVLKTLNLKAKVTRIGDAAPADLVLTQEPLAGTRVDPKTDVALTVSKGPDTDTQPGDVARLTRAMARDPRSEQDGRSEDDIAALLHKADVSTLEDAHALADLPAAKVRDRLQLGGLTQATRFRALLRKSLKGID